MDKLVWTGPEDGRRFAFAHGAGAPMDAPFMERVAEALGEAGLRVARFEFPYMAKRRETGKKRPPDGQKILRETWHHVVAAASNDGAERLWIGGKSMGGRLATMVADELDPVAGVVCFGYPFHPSGQPDKLRVDHLRDLKTPTLIVQGDRDSLGTKEEVATYRLASTIRLEWLPDGNHDFLPRHKSGYTAKEHQAKAARLAAAFVLSSR